MALLEFTSLKGMEVISQDALIIGEVTDIRCEDVNWTIKGINLKTRKTVSDKLNAGFGKSTILVKPGEYTIKDVVLFPDELDSARNRVIADSNDFVSIQSMIGKKVISDEAVNIGIVDEVIVDLKEWSVVSIKIKLTKDAHEPLGVKKGLLGCKVVSGILASDIELLDANQIKLCLNISDIKGKITAD